MPDIKSYLSKEKTLLFPNTNPESRLVGLLDSTLDKLTVSSKQTNLPRYFWGPKRYGFDRTDLFKRLEQEQQEQVYRKLTELSLSLSYFIERSGHNYGSKMILMSETQEEKSLYALFCAEEAIHQREFENFMDFRPNPEIHWHPMLNPLASAIEEAEKDTCVYIIQVLLEGFGMSFYNGLGQTCEYGPLKEIYQRILIDEARHHGTGVILANESRPSNLVKDQIFEYTREFITALTSANWPIQCIGEHIEISDQEEKKFHEQYNSAEVLGQRVIKMREMLSKVDSWGLVDRLISERIIH